MQLALVQREVTSNVPYVKRAADATNGPVALASTWRKEDGDGELKFAPDRWSAIDALYKREPIIDVRNNPITLFCELCNLTG